MIRANSWLQRVSGSGSPWQLSTALPSTTNFRFSSQARHFSHHKPATPRQHPFSVVLGAFILGGVGALTYQQHFATSRNAGETDPSSSTRKTRLAHVPDIDGSSTSDGIKYLPVLTAEEAGRRLNEGAFSCRVEAAAGIDRYDGAQLASNAICEDAYIHGKFPSPLKTGIGGADWMVWGVFDGHNGWQTAELLTRQLLPYIRRALQNIEPEGDTISDEAIRTAISAAFEELDDLLIKSAKEIIDSDLSYPEKVKRLEPAHSGACALLTLYDPSAGKFHIASAGDCRAVMGYQDAGGEWEAMALTKDHTGSNKNEIARLKAQFPDEPNIFRSSGRVYGMQPSRSFGDGVYKWNTELRERLRAEFNAHKQPHSSWYPGIGDGPYLTASPDVTTIQLSEYKRPAFLIQATDGLWDMMGNQNAIDLVGRWCETQKASIPKNEKKQTSDTFPPVRIGRSGCWYSDSRATYQDSNAAVHLIRNGLGGSHDEMVRGALSFTYPLSRFVRDDITVQVIFLTQADNSNL